MSTYLVMRACLVSAFFAELMPSTNQRWLLYDSESKKVRAALLDFKAFVLGTTERL